MKLVALCNICGIFQQRDVLPGEPFEARDEAHGAEMIGAGIACLPEEYKDITQPSPADNQGNNPGQKPADAQGSDLLDAIQAAETPEALLALMPEVEPAPEIVAAFEARMKELEPDH